MQNHPTASRSQHYEWFYPASAYVDLIQSVGFSLVGVIPFGYRNNELLGLNQANSDELTAEVDSDMAATVDHFWDEVEALRRKKPVAERYSVPQAMIFRRVAI
jgi:hypothetical protein